MILRIRDAYGNVQEVLTLKGEKGEKGDPPVKGEDYFTDDEKTDIVNSVLAALPAETWTFTLEDDTEVKKTVVLK